MLKVEEYKHLPSCPGVYRFYDSKRRLIYVGKARDLNSRVSSYFSKNVINPKTQQLVTEVRFIDYITVFSEQDAFLLEDNLIKENQPRYNILLKDDKTYPYIIVTNEPYPRLAITERPEKKTMFTFGPFSNYGFVENICGLVRSVFQIRTCNLSLSSKNISEGKYKVCLKYHLGECCGVCASYSPQEEYVRRCREGISFLKGNFGIVKRKLKHLMITAAEKKEYKLAQKYKEQIEAVEMYKSHSIVTNTKDMDIDVFFYEKKGNVVYICYMIVKKGKIIFEKTFTEIEKYECKNFE